MPSPAAPSASIRNLLRRFRRNRNASAAVEFALVAPVFFGLLFAIIETSIIFFADQVLETITQDSARLIATGQAQTGQVMINGVAACAAAPCTQAEFQTYVCSRVPALLFTCPPGVNGIFIDVESYPVSAGGFTNVTINNQISGGAFINNMQYSTGGPTDIVVVRLFYQWPQYVTGLGYNITNLTGNKRLLVATAVLKNEPY
jgi:Flp pilus assembly protein TadG